MGNKRTLTKRKEQPHIAGYGNSQLLQMLEALAVRLGVQIRYEKGDFQSAGCRVDERRLIILQKSDSDSAKIAALMRELGRFDLSHLDVEPALLNQILQSHQESTLQGLSVQEEK